MCSLLIESERSESIEERVGGERVRAIGGEGKEAEEAEDRGGDNNGGRGVGVRGAREAVGRVERVRLPREGSGRRACGGNFGSWSGSLSASCRETRLGDGGEGVGRRDEVSQ